MKQVIAIMNHDDARTVSSALAKKGFSSTRMDSRGGFLDKPNMTVFIGVDDMRVRDVLRIIGENTRSREYDVTVPEETDDYSLPEKVKAGGAVVFVLDVDQFHKL